MRHDFRVIVRMYGGLGNQLFQFAGGEWLRASMGCRVCYDVVSGFASEPFKRAFELDDLVPLSARVDGAECAAPDRVGMLLFRVEQASAMVCGRYWAPYSAAIRLLALAGNARLVIKNYFQDYSEVSGGVSDLIKAYLIRRQRSPIQLELEYWIRDRPTLGVHLRLGRDLSSTGEVVRPGLANTNLPISYFTRAIERLWASGEYDRIVVLTDSADVGSVNNLLMIACGGVPSYRIVPLQASGWDCLSVMSVCAGLVIANSTLSAWGAGLNSHVRCLAPLTWRASRYGVSLQSVCPPNAERI